MRHRNRIDMVSDHLDMIPQLLPGQSNYTTYYGWTSDPFVRIRVERHLDHDGVLRTTKRVTQRVIDFKVGFVGDV